MKTHSYEKELQELIAERERLCARVEALEAALKEQDVYWAMLQMTHPHLVGPQRDDIITALAAGTDAGKGG